LRRTGTGGFTVSQCVTLEQLEAMNDEERKACLLPVDSLLPDHVSVTLDSENAGRFLSGVRRRGAWADAQAVAVYGPSPTSNGQERALLGTAHIKGGELIPGRLLSPVEIEESQKQQEQIS
jgi:tRNA pseudouridine55 synthase